MSIGKSLLSGIYNKHIQFSTNIINDLVYNICTFYTWYIYATIMYDQSKKQSNPNVTLPATTRF